LEGGGEDGLDLDLVLVLSGLGDDGLDLDCGLLDSLSLVFECLSEFLDELQ